jgi:hypothetical protein
MTKTKTNESRAVPPPRSVYRKIQIILKEARKAKSESIEALIESVRSRGELDFTCCRANEEGVIGPVPCSLDSVARVVTVCRDLGLIQDSDGKPKLTADGLKAVDVKYFDGVMRRVLAKALKNFGTPVEAIRKAASDLLSQEGELVLPTWESLYDRLALTEDGRSRENFRIYLGLLAGCQGIDYSMKKTSLP